MKRYILTLAIFVFSLNAGKAAREITDLEIKDWFIHADLVLICSVNRIDTILIKRVDSLTSDGTINSYELIRERYHISVDSILKHSSNSVYPVDTIFSQDFVINNSYSNYNKGVIKTINEKGDTLTVDEKINITISTDNFSDDSYFRLKQNKKHLVILSLNNNGYMIDYETEHTKEMLDMIQNYQIYNEKHNQVTYDFINSIFYYHLKEEIEFYQLYYKPTTYQFITSLEDSLSEYLTDTDLQNMIRQSENIDLDFFWIEDRLDNCKVLNEKERIANRKEIPISTSALIIDSSTNKPIETDRTEVPKEIRQIYYFTKPVWNSDSTYVVFHSDLNEVNRCSSKTFLYKKINDNWTPFIEFYGVSWQTH